MRLAVVIVALAAIAVAVVHIRHDRMRFRHEAQDSRMRQVVLRRQLWDQQVRLGWETTPAEIRRRADEMALPLVEKFKQDADANAPKPAGASAGKIGGPHPHD